LHLHQSVIISFVKQPPLDPRDKFVAAVSTSALLNGSSFFSPSSAASLGNFQTIRRARREAGTRPRSPRFKWRASTPHPPLHQPSGAESTTMNGSSRALVCELHERATRPRQRPSSRKVGVAHAERLHGTWVGALGRGTAYDAHESTGKPEHVGVPERRERTPRAGSPYIRGMRRSGPDDVLGGILACVLG